MHALDIGIFMHHILEISMHLILEVKNNRILELFESIFDDFWCFLLHFGCEAVRGGLVFVHCEWVILPPGLGFFGLVLGFVFSF